MRSRVKAFNVKAKLKRSDGDGQELRIMLGQEFGILKHM